MAKRPTGLGRGLDAILGDINRPVDTAGAENFNEIDLDKIEANPNQPRTQFDETALDELAASIRENGLITPITLRRIEGATERYQIISGERRWRASKMLGLTKIPAYVKAVEQEQDVELMALIENVQREDLNAIEIALSLQKLTDTFSLTQEELSKKVGKKRETVSNYMRLLKLPAEVQLALRDRLIDMGHARPLITLQSAETQLDIFKKTIDKKLSVREVESLVKAARARETNDAPASPQKTDTGIRDYSALRDQIARYFGEKVKLDVARSGKGKITIPFDSSDDLERILGIMDKISG